MSSSSSQQIHSGRISSSRSNLSNTTDTSSSSAYNLSSRDYSHDYQNTVKERQAVENQVYDNDHIVNQDNEIGDQDDNISLNIRQSFGPPSPIQKSGKKGKVVELNDYTVHGVVGRGKFSTVYLATRNMDNVKVALKKIKLGSTPKERVREKCLREVHLLQTLQHPNIIRYLDSFIAHPNSLGIVIEWATGGDLRKHLSNIAKKNIQLPEPVIWKSFVQICNAIAHMHDRRVLHRDLKPANIFIMDNGSIKVGDLGLGRTLSDDTPEAFSKVGTPLYMSPESLKGEAYDEKSDIWSLGCILYEMAMLHSPFKEKGLKMFQLFEKIIKGNYPEIPSTSIYSPYYIKLVNVMLSNNPNDRPTIWKTRTIAMLALNEIINRKKNKMGISVPPQIEKKIKSSIEESVKEQFNNNDNNNNAKFQSNDHNNVYNNNNNNNNNNSNGNGMINKPPLSINAENVSNDTNLTDREKDLMQRAYLVGCRVGGFGDVKDAWKSVETAAENYAVSTRKSFDTNNNNKNNLKMISDSGSDHSSDASSDYFHNNNNNNNTMNMASMSINKKPVLGSSKSLSVLGGMAGNGNMKNKSNKINVISMKKQMTPPRNTYALRNNLVNEKTGPSMKSGTKQRRNSGRKKGSPPILPPLEATANIDLAKLGRSRMNKKGMVKSASANLSENFQNMAMR